MARHRFAFPVKSGLWERGAFPAGLVLPEALDFLRRKGSGMEKASWEETDDLYPPALMKRAFDKRREGWRNILIASIVYAAGMILLCITALCAVRFPGIPFLAMVPGIVLLLWSVSFFARGQEEVIGSEIEIAAWEQSALQLMMGTSFEKLCQIMKIAKQNEANPMP